MSAIEIIRIYPDPAKTVVEVKLYLAYNAKLEVFFTNHKNHEVMKVPYLQNLLKGHNTISINVAPLKPGIYNISISDGHEICVSSLSISR